MLYSATDVVLYKVLLIDVAVAKASAQMHLLCPLFLDLIDKTCHKISASRQQIRFFIVSSAHLECNPSLGMCVDRSDPWMTEFSLTPPK